MRQNSNGRCEVTERTLKKTGFANEALLAKMAADSEGDLFSAAEAVVSSAAEMEVLRYITQALMEDEGGNAENPPFSEERLGAAFLHLKNVVDAFTSAQDRPCML
jgi:hypothetical protein